MNIRPPLFISLFLAYFCCAVPTANAKEEIHIVYDISGSMEKYHAVFEELFAHLQLLEHLEDKQRRLSLYSFTEKYELEAEGNNGDILSAMSAIKYSGGVEDGLIPIEEIINNNRDGVILLITDEGRQAIAEIDSVDLIAQAKKQNIQIHTIIKHRFTCDSEKLIGVNGKLESIHAAGNTSNCLEIGSEQMLINTLGRKKSAYAELALATGGTIWSLDSISESAAPRPNTTDKVALARWMREPRSFNPENMENFAQALFYALNEAKNKFSVSVSTYGSRSVGEQITVEAIVTHKSSGDISTPTLTWDFDRDGVEDYEGNFPALVVPANTRMIFTVWVTTENGTKEAHRISL